MISLTPIPLFLVLSPHQGLPPVLPPLPKRPALEKANGATTMFNAGVFQYQQALANMQFQQQAAFIPSGKAWSLLQHMSVAIAIGCQITFSLSQKSLLASAAEWLKDCVISLLVTNCMELIAHVCTANLHCFKLGPCICPNNDSLFC